MKNLKSDLWQILLSPSKARTHLHNVDDHYYHGDDDGGGDDDDGGGDNNEDDDEDKGHLTALFHLIFVEVGVKIIPQTPSPGSNCLKLSSLLSLSSPG